jgi:hypothetical protein
MIESGRPPFLLPAFLINSVSHNKKAMRENRMTEIASPASDPRSLRRHYPHQVQGVVQLDLSAIAAPPLC